MLAVKKPSPNKEILYRWKGRLKGNRIVSIKHHVGESCSAGNGKEWINDGASTPAAGAVKIMQMKSFLY
ncbi:hypothetical protein TNCV_531671 [Trichonephila clavipes]|nr:hypothetical protein TNCV_531671 [Trichonephila clavipes]